MGAKTLSKSEIKELNEQTLKYFQEEFFHKKDFVQIISEKIKYIALNKEPLFFYHGDKLVPSLKTLMKRNFLKTITVDMGAIKFICSGADVMRPGIVELDEDIHKGEIVVVLDVNNKKPLVVGRALFSGVEIKGLSEGKVVENLHFVSDDKWNLS